MDARFERVLMLSFLHQFMLLKGTQSQIATKDQLREHTRAVSSVTYTYSVGSPCYAVYCGPKRNRVPRWVPAVVSKVFGTRSVNVRVVPCGPTWRRHLDQLRPRYRSEEDLEPGELPSQSVATEPLDRPSMEVKESTGTSETPKAVQESRPKRRNPRLPNDDQYGRHNLRRSRRHHQRVNLTIASGKPLAGREVL